MSTWQTGRGGPCRSSGGGGLPEQLWFSVPREHGRLLSERADAAVCVLLIPAMRSGSQVRFTGPVTSALAHWQGDAQAVYSLMGHGDPVTHVFDDPRPADTPPGGVATGFSAGIDSWTVLAEHHYGDVPDTERLTHLLFNNVGSHASADPRGLWAARLSQLAPVAGHIGLPLVDVDSNMDDFYGGPHDFQATHTPRNAAVAHVLAGGLGLWLYASAWAYGQSGPGPGRGYDTSFTDAMVLPLLSTPGLMLRSSGGRHTRVEKTRLVAELEDAWGSLDVCTVSSDGSNCSNCSKCLRTMVTLDSIGALDRFTGQFDLTAFAGRRARWLANGLRSFDPQVGEVVALVRESGGLGWDVRARAVKYRARALLPGR